MTINREELIEKICVEICKNAYPSRNPYDLEPGDLPKIDGYKKNGDPAHYVWRHFTNQAEAVLKAIGEYLPAPLQDYYTIDGELYYTKDGKKYHVPDNEEVYDYEYLYTQFKNICEGK